MQTFWPFLYAANPDLDYRTVVAPDFLVRGKNVSLLRQNVDVRIDQRTEGEIRSTQVDANGIGPVTLFYRSVFVKEKSGKAAHDDHGRPIVRVNGIAFRDLKDKSEFGPGEIETLIEEAEANLDQKFLEFWSTSSGHRAIPSTPMRFDHGQAGLSSEPEKGHEKQEEPPKRPSMWRYFFAGALSVVAVEVVFLTIYLSFRDPEPDPVNLLKDEMGQIKELIEEIHEKLQ